MKIFFLGICCWAVLISMTYVSRAQTNELLYWESYGQHIPIAASVGLGWFGVEAQDKCFGRIAKLGTSIVCESVLVRIGKHTIKKERPDNSAYDSFPSGHTAAAFTGAEIVRHEYGNAWGIGAYMVASAVGLSRVYHKRHYLGDVAGGAALGFISARIGIFCTNQFQKFYNNKKTQKISFSPVFLKDGFGVNLMLYGI